MRWRLFFVALVLTLAAGALVLERFAERLEPANASGSPQLFTVARGSTLADICRSLEAEGLVRSALVTEWVGRLDARQVTLRAGEYEVSPAWTPREILTHLSEGPTKTYEVVLPEGLRAEQIAGRLESAGLVSSKQFLALVRDPEFVLSLGLEGETLEGYLFPETYRIPRGLPAAEVVRILTREFQRAWKKVEAAAAKRNMSMRDVIILASIVEKETAAPKERPRIASVFHNRLEKNIRLATDPTVIYGIANFDGNLKRRHLEDPSNPYNTYKHPGLPPGPISNPGEAALLAVVEPEDSDYLFFVSKNDGTHVFSKTYAEHERAVDYYQRRRRSR